MEKQKRKPLSRTQKRNIFFALMVLYPLLVFVLFYVVVNFNTIILSFTEYSSIPGEIGYIRSFSGLKNFRVVFEMLKFENNYMMVVNSVKLFVYKLLIGLPISFIFAYYIYKKYRMYKFFRVICFLPNIIPNLIMVYLFKFLVNQGIIALFNAQRGLLQNPTTEFGTILFFNLWLGFATQTLVFASAMSGIDRSIIEAAQMDGATPIQELWHIILPSIFKTFETYVLVGIAMMFVDQMSLMTFYDKFDIPGNMRTVGYYLYVQSYQSDFVPSTIWENNHAYGKLPYSQISAFSLLISLVIIPITLIVRKLFNKYGPSED